MRWALRIFGFIIFMIGLLLTVTIIGAPLGFPMMIVGSVMAFASLFVGSSKTTITNVIHVGNAPNPGTQAPSPAPTRPVIDAEAQHRIVEQAAQEPRQLPTASFCTGCGAAVVGSGSAFCAQCGNRL
jgi:hypothetical protein